MLKNRWEMHKYNKKQGKKYCNRSGKSQTTLFFLSNHCLYCRRWLRYKKLTISVFCSISFLLLNSAYADNLSLFREIVKENSKIKTVEADIIQYIDTPGNSAEVYKGRYRADRRGRFRIDYKTPSTQIVVNNGKSLYWYYPKDKLLYKIGRRANIMRSPKISPLKEFAKNFEKNFRIEYLGKQLYGFFKIAHQFVISDKKGRLVTDIWVDVKKKVILAKIITDKDGDEVMKELFQEYKKIKNIFFPSRIDVYARTAGGITKNITKYNNVNLNSPFRNNIFKLNFPSDVKVRHLQE